MYYIIYFEKEQKMKKKILLCLCTVAMLACLFAISVSAATTEVIGNFTYYLNKGNATVTSANQSCALETVIIPETVTGADGNEYTVKTIDQNAFNGNLNLKYLSLPATITKIGPAAFKGCKNLQFVDFNDNQNDIDFNNWGHFAECTSLKAFAFPDNVTTITNRVLYKCTSLEAVYLPANAVKIGTNGNGQGPFCGNTKMYLVSEKFEVTDENGDFYGDSFVQPAKPSVYVMPSTLTTVIGHVRKEFGGTGGGGSYAGSLFQNCTSINDVIVFGDGFGYIGCYNMFSGMGTSSSPKSVVFLGDIQGAVTLQSAQYVSLVFANANDKTPSNLGFVSIVKNVNNTSSYMYFCIDGSKYDYHTSNAEITDATAVSEYVNGLAKISEAYHVANPLKTETTPADCVNDRAETTYCFCKAKIGSNPVEGTALGHEYDLAKGAVKSKIEYANYLASGILNTKCARCEECNESSVAPIISSFDGFSTKIASDGLVIKYTVNKEAIDEYVKVNGGSIELGFVVAAKHLAGEELIGTDGKATANVMKMSVITHSASSESGVYYSGAELKITGTWDGTVDVDGVATDVKEVKFYMAGYIISNGVVSYLNKGGSSVSADYASYSDMIEA